MTKKKATKKTEGKLPEDIRNDDHPHYYNRSINTIILQQSGGDEIKHDQAHYFIAKSGGIVKGLALDKAGKHCEDNDKDSIGIILEGYHYSPMQQAALMNVIYTCMNELGKELDVKPYSVFHPGRVNPNLNIRSLMNRYTSTYVKK